MPPEAGPRFLTKFAFRIRTRSGTPVENLMVQAPDQAQAEARVLLLAGRLREVVLIDDTVPDPGIVSPGTEVEVEIEGAGAARYWILGEGDGEMGSDVVSYRAPIGLALLGRRPGDATQWSAEGREVRAVVRAIRTRLPDAETSPGRTS